MKNTKTISCALLLFVLAFTGCTYKNKINSLITQNDSLIKSNSFLSTLTIPTDACIASKYSSEIHPILAPDAKAYIFPFATNFGIVANMGWTDITRASLAEYEDEASGGEDENPRNHCGLVLYMCYNPSSRYYLAYNHNDNLIDTLDPFPLTNMARIYNKSNCAQRFNPETDLQTPALLEAAMQRASALCEADTVTLTADSVNKEANNFLIQILGLNTELPGVLENPIGFFHRNQISKLLKQNDGDPADDDCRAVRIYWAYKPGVPFNKIKLVMFGVKKNGEIIWDTQTKEAIVMQQSWPPY